MKDWKVTVELPDEIRMYYHNKWAEKKDLKWSEYISAKVIKILKEGMEHEKRTEQTQQKNNKEQRELSGVLQSIQSAV
jgi:5-bromo-4-chloroindolyl phosphate hydrolysis protein